MTQLAGLNAPALLDGAAARDLTALLWCSIDNDDSRDLDQLTVAEALPNDRTKVFVAVADVDSLVRDGCPLDEHARHNTTSVYTAAEIFPMLPEKLSTDLTSLNFHEERLAMVVEMVVDTDGSVCGVGDLPRPGAQSGEARLRQRGGVVGGEGAAAGADWRGGRGWRRTCGCRIAWRSC